MPVNDVMRRVERDIDERLEELPLWRCARDDVLRATLDYYRLAHETTLIFAAAAIDSDNKEVFDNVALQLQRFQAGCFQVLKWTFSWCPEQSAQTFTGEMIHEAQDLGSKYEALVDVLKFAKHDQIEIVVDESARQVTVYEGGDVTGADWSLVDHQRRTNLFHSHVSLTEDADQLTRAWTAGVYRRTIRWLGDVAREGQGDTVMLTLPSGDHVPLFSRPTIIRVPEPPDREIEAVLDDLTLTPEKVSGPQVWDYVSWLDTPLVALGTERLGPSDLLVALAGLGGDDHMLRLAAAADNKQYVKVSGLREIRMIELCCDLLKQQKWKVNPRYKLRDPDREIDVYAIREGVGLVLQLKSTLRPEAAGEVYNRNEDVIEGIAQARDTRAQIGSGAIGAVITDGYRGDYTTWRHALEHQIPIGTLDDIPDIARNPHQIFELLKSRVGFDDIRPEGAPFERSCDLMGWTVRIVDSRPMTQGLLSLGSSS
jgi:hypothetical protein